MRWQLLGVHLLLYIVIILMKEYEKEISEKVISTLDSDGNKLTRQTVNKATTEERNKET